MTFRCRPSFQTISNEGRTWPALLTIGPLSSSDILFLPKGPAVHLPIFWITCQDRDQSGPAVHAGVASPHTRVFVAVRPLAAYVLTYETVDGAAAVRSRRCIVWYVSSRQAYCDEYACGRGAWPGYRHLACIRKAVGAFCKAVGAFVKLLVHPFESKKLRFIVENLYTARRLYHVVRKSRAQPPCDSPERRAASLRPAEAAAPNSNVVKLIVQFLTLIFLL
ncbi:hypothetical protein EVAR_85248_1 [Eumeta japonica]|uniref:Uncharacterized protein n=1 Tax=Eumeta variegata TaxID=151549 RepID=A0A4C1W1P8_EUMVA|nr:hypothetical protein EVAR_85248_1 [Eumeta japonica]